MTTEFAAVENWKASTRATFSLEVWVTIASAQLKFSKNLLKIGVLEVGQPTYLFAHPFSAGLIGFLATTAAAVVSVAALIVATTDAQRIFLRLEILWTLLT